MSETQRTESTPPTSSSPDAAAAAAPAAGPRAKLGHRLEEAKATARKVLVDARHLGERARAEANKVTTRGREQWLSLAPRARDLSDRARTRVRAAWTDQLAGARAGLARVRAAFGKRAA